MTVQYKHYKTEFADLRSIKRQEDEEWMPETAENI